MFVSALIATIPISNWNNFYDQFPNNVGYLWRIKGLSRKKVVVKCLKCPGMDVIYSCEGEKHEWLEISDIKMVHSNLTSLVAGIKSRFPELSERIEALMSIAH